MALILLIEHLNKLRIIQPLHWILVVAKPSRRVFLGMFTCPILQEIFGTWNFLILVGHFDIIMVWIKDIWHVQLRLSIRRYLIIKLVFGWCLFGHDLKVSVFQSVPGDFDTAGWLPSINQEEAGINMFSLTIGKVKLWSQAHPKHIPSTSWIRSQRHVLFLFSKAVDTQLFATAFSQ